jgi:hypothetical protein
VRLSECVRWLPLDLLALEEGEYGCDPPMSVGLACRQSNLVEDGGDVFFDGPSPR